MSQLCRSVTFLNRRIPSQYNHIRVPSIALQLPPILSISHQHRFATNDNNQNSNDNKPNPSVIRSESESESESESQNLNSNPNITEDKILEAEREQQLAFESAIGVTAMPEERKYGKQFERPDIHLDEEIEKQKRESRYKFGMPRGVFRTLVILVSCTIGASSYYKLKATPITKNINSRNMHFFARLNANPNVTVTYSGLMYRMLNKIEKTEDMRYIVNPDPEQHVVQIHYEGRLMDGKVFDSSFDDKPVTFAAKSLIPGLHQGIAKMTRGSTCEFYIPPHLAYGEKGSSFIPPHEPLIFRVKLMDFWKDTEVNKYAGKLRLSL